ncbi:MAG: acyl-CoA dehydrogenase family protein [Pseudorhodoplanes sp.]
MDFELTEEQSLLREMTARLIAEDDAAERAVAADRPDGFSRKRWRRFSELGLLGLPFDEDQGGVGGTALETMLVMEQFGRGLVIEPYLASVVLSGNALRLGDKPELLPGIAAGECLVAFAHQEEQARYDLAHVETGARPNEGGYVLDGTKTLVLHGDSADWLVVSARLSGERTDKAGIGLFLVKADARGVTRHGYRTIDGRRAAEIALSDVSVAADACIGTPGDAFALIERVIAIAIAAVAAEAVGCMNALMDLTVEYLKTRKQFGAPIGSFQALQHRAADMLIATEQARSMAMFAAMMADDPDPVARRKAIAAAKVQIGKSGKLVGKEAIQLHGGIGMTDEYKAGHYFKRLTVIDALFGDADHHLGVLARTDGLFSD